MPFIKLEEGPHQLCNYIGNLILNFPASSCEKLISAAYKLPILWYFVIAS